MSSHSLKETMKGDHTNITGINVVALFWIVFLVKQHVVHGVLLRVLAVTQTNDLRKYK